MAQNNEMKFKILVIDDEPDVVATVCDSVNDDRYEFTGETDSARAMQLIQSEAFDVVITDLMMPDYNGMDIVAGVKNSGFDTLVVVLTGQATLETAIESLQLGVYDYLHKPIHARTLACLLDRATQRLSLQRANKALTERNMNLLKNIVLLTDVSKILYQVTGLDDALDMISDTLTEYFGFKHIALFVENVQDGNFRVSKTNMADFRSEAVVFTLKSRINGEHLEKDSISEINLEKGIKVDGKRIAIDKSFFRLLVVPLVYQEHVVAFLGLFLQEKETRLSDDLRMLLNTLCAQAAPVLYALNTTTPKSRPAENHLYYYIREQISTAKTLLSPISFGLMRFELFSESGEAYIIKDVLDNATKIVAEYFDGRAELLWQTPDTALLVMPDTDVFNAETLCRQAKENLAGNIVEGHEDHFIKAVYACSGYPEAGETAGEILENLWLKLFDEVRRHGDVLQKPEKHS